MSDDETRERAERELRLAKGAAARADHPTPEDPARRRRLRSWRSLIRGAPSRALELGVTLDDQVDLEALAPPEVLELGGVEYEIRDLPPETDPGRETALDVLVSRFPKPLHPDRWKLVKRRLGDEGTASVRDLVPGALLEAAELDPADPREHGKVVDGRSDRGTWLRLQRALSRLITRDLLGRGWRRPHDRLDQQGRLPEEETQGVRQVRRLAVAADQLEFVVAADADQKSRRERAAREIECADLADRAQLGRREREVYIRVDGRGLTVTEAASELGIEPGAARVALHRARRKIARLA